MERCVNQSTPPAIRSSRESSVDAAIAMEPLLTVANTSKVWFLVKVEQTTKKGNTKCSLLHELESKYMQINVNNTILNREGFNKQGCGN